MKREGLELEQGYRLIKQGKANLGWRVVTHLDHPSNFAEVIKTTYEERTPFPDLLPEDYKERHLEALESDSENDDEHNHDKPTDEPSKVRIKITNLFGPKGLSSLHTIIAGMNEGTFPANENDIQEDEACKFIGAMTRARRSCAIVT